MLAVLKERFEVKDDVAIELVNVVEEVNTEIRFKGEYMTHSQENI